MRTRAWRRAQRKRLIKRRLEIVKNVWFWGPGDFEQWSRRIPYMAKWNLVCSCFMCRSEKYRDTLRKYDKA